MAVMDYATLFEAIVDAVIVIDEHGEILDVNQGCLVMFGYKKADVIGQNVTMLMEADQAALHDGYIRSFLTTRNPKIIGQGREVRAVQAQGRAFLARLTVAEAQYAGVHQFVGILQDLSKQHEAEAQANEAMLKLQQLDRSTTVAELGSALAHELNQPLTALTLYLKSAQRYLGDSEHDEALRGLFDKAAIEGRRAADIIKRIRSMIEQREIETRPVRVSGLMQDVVRFMKSVLKDPDTRIVLQHSSDDVFVDVDPIQLSQVLTNLIKNAAEAVGTREGKATIQLSWQRDPAQGDIVVLVDDDGPGFTEDILAEVFKSFRTTKAGGLGIGLSLSKRFIEQMNGSMTASNDSALGGARVQLRLPLAESIP